MAVAVAVAPAPAPAVALAVAGLLRVSADCCVLLESNLPKPLETAVILVTMLHDAHHHIHHPHHYLSEVRLPSA